MVQLRICKKVSSTVYRFDIVSPTSTVVVSLEASSVSNESGDKEVASTETSITFNPVTALAPTNFNLGGNVNGINLVWTSNDDSPTFLVARGSSAVTFNPANGTSCEDYSGTQGSEEVFCVDGKNSIFDEIGSSGTYHYAVWAVSESNYYSSSVIGNETSIAGIANGGFESGVIDPFTNESFSSRMWETYTASAQTGVYSATSSLSLARCYRT